MANPLSSAGTAAAVAQETARIFLDLVTIDHDDLDDPIRLVANNEDIMSRGNRFTAANIEFTPGEEREDGIAKGQLVLGNVARWFTPSLRNLTGDFTVTIERVTDTNLSASPPAFDQLEVAYLPMQLSDVEFDAKTVRGNLSYDHELECAWPDMTFNPTDFPGLF